jgi:hypothetical protein
MSILKLETLEALDSHGKTIKDVIWVGCKDFKISIEKFLEISNREYDSGFGGQEVAIDLIVGAKIFGLKDMTMMGLNGGNIKKCQKNQKRLLTILILFLQEEVGIV